MSSTTMSGPDHVVSEGFALRNMSTDMSARADTG